MELKAHDFSKLAKLNRYSSMHMTRAGPKMTNGKQNKKTTSSITSQSSQRLHTNQGNRGEVIPYGYTMNRSSEALFGMPTNRAGQRIRREL